MTLRAITFDAGGTLFEPWPSVGHVYSKVAADYGIQAEADLLNARFRRAWQEKSAFKYTQPEWFELVRQSFGTDAAISQEICAAIYHHFASSDCWRVYPDVIPALELARSCGLRLAVVSNWDERLRPMLSALHLAPYFEHIFISIEIGAPKPSPQIFEAALQTLGVEPREAIHLGDSEVEDVQGAQEVGMAAQLIRRKSGAGDEALLQAVRAAISPAGS